MFGVVEKRRRLDLGVEAVACAGLLQLGWVDGLEGDQPVHGDLTGLVDDAHPAAIDLLHDLEAGDSMLGTGVRRRLAASEREHPSAERQAGQMVPQVGRHRLAHRVFPAMPARAFETHGRHERSRLLRP